MWKRARIPARPAPSGEQFHTTLPQTPCVSPLPSDPASFPQKTHPQIQGYIQIHTHTQHRQIHRYICVDTCTDTHFQMHMQTFTDTHMQTSMYTSQTRTHRHAHSVGHITSQGPVPLTFLFSATSHHQSSPIRTDCPKSGLSFGGLRNGTGPARNGSCSPGIQAELTLNHIQGHFQLKGSKSQPSPGRDKSHFLIVPIIRTVSDKEAQPGPFLSGDALAAHSVRPPTYPCV